MFPAGFIPAHHTFDVLLLTLRRCLSFIVRGWLCSVWRGCAQPVVVVVVGVSPRSGRIIQRPFWYRFLLRVPPRTHHHSHGRTAVACVLNLLRVLPRITSYPCRRAKRWETLDEDASPARPEQEQTVHQESRRLEERRVRDVFVRKRDCRKRQVNQIHAERRRIAGNLPCTRLTHMNGRSYFISQPWFESAWISSQSD